MISPPSLTWLRASLRPRVSNPTAWLSPSCAPSGTTVCLNPLPAANTVLGQLGLWFDDHRRNRPHSGLGMCSPREFIRDQLPAKVSG